MSANHGNVMPTRCAVCSETIAAGTGLFVVIAGDGVLHVHAGGCARKSGAYPGSAAVWGERAALASAMIATDGISERDAAEAVRFRESEGGFVLLDALFAMLQVAAIVFFATCVFRIAAHRGVVVMPVAQAEASVVAADHVPRGVSR